MLAPTPVKVKAISLASKRVCEINLKANAFFQKFYGCLSILSGFQEIERNKCKVQEIKK